LKIINVEGDKELTVKRLTLPVRLDVLCPDCNQIGIHDFEDNYLSYPILNEAECTGYYCEHCDEEFEFDVTLRVSLEVSEELRKYEP
jgi:hypothetical protein